MSPAHALPAGHWVTRRGIQVWVPAPPAPRLRVAPRPARRPARPTPLPADLTELAAALGVHPGDLLVRDRSRAACDTRAVAAWVLRAPGRSLPEIGRLLERDHKTILHSIRRVNATPKLLARARAVLDAPADLKASA